MIDKDVQQIKSKYGGHWGEHPLFPLSRWRKEVAENNLRIGYWEWVIQTEYAET